MAGSQEQKPSLEEACRMLDEYNARADELYLQGSRYKGIRPIDQEYRDYLNKAADLVMIFSPEERGKLLSMP